MNSSFLSRCNCFVVILVIASCVQTYAQSNIYLFGMGGINYTPMQNFSHLLHQLADEKIDEIGFNGGFGIKYFLSENQSILLSVEVVSKNASYSGGFTGAVWNFKVIPIAIGYQYLFSDKQESFRPYAGLNISYSFIEIHGQHYSDEGSVPDDFIKKNTISIEPNIGVIYKIVNKFFFLSEFKYRAMGDIEYWTREVNLSGLIFNVGIQVNIL